jgi:hypothetical protein
MNPAESEEFEKTAELIPSSKFLQLVSFHELYFRFVSKGNG